MQILARTHFFHFLPARPFVQSPGRCINFAKGNTKSTEVRKTTFRLQLANFCFSLREVMEIFWCDDAFGFCFLLPFFFFNISPFDAGIREQLTMRAKSFERYHVFFDEILPEFDVGALISPNSIIFFFTFPGNLLIKSSRFHEKYNVSPLSWYKIMPEQLFALDLRETKRCEAFARLSSRNE